MEDDGKYKLFFYQDFEQHNAPIEYTNKLWNPDWNNPGWRDGDNRPSGWWEDNIKDSIVVDNETGSKVMKFNFSDTIIDGVGGYWPVRGGDLWVTDLGAEPKELYFSYNVKFRPGFVFVKGGKLPGTKGGTHFSSKTLFSSSPPADDEGYSCNLLFKTGGRIQWYLYHHDREEKYGEAITWDTFQPEGLVYSSGAVSLDVSSERWYNITMRIVVNTINDGKINRDGIMEGYIDGKLVSQLTGMYLIPASDVDKGVNTLSIAHFFGGTGNQYSPVRDEWTLFDDFVCFTYDESVDVPRGNTPSPPGRVLDLPNLKTSQTGQEDNEPPSVPEGVKLKKKADSFLDIGWDSSTDNTGVAGYRIFVNGNRHGLSQVNSYSIDGLEPNTTYSITVSAFDDASNESDRSPAIFPSTLDIDTIPPTVPAGLQTVDISLNSISIKWENSTDDKNLDGYRIYLDDIGVGSTSSASYSFSDLQPNTTYEIAVSSLDASSNESQKSIPLSARTMSRDTIPPTVPIDLDIIKITDTSVDIIWTSSIDDIEVAGYNIYLNGILNSKSSDNSHSILYLNPGTNYSIAVSSYDKEQNESEKSNTIFIITENTENTDDTDNSAASILPVIDLVKVSNVGASNSISTITEIKSVGHSEIIDFGLLISVDVDDSDIEPVRTIFSDLENVEQNFSNRVTEGLELSYDFTEGKGDRIYDRAKSANSIDLKIVNPLAVSWISGHGLRIDENALITSEQVPSGLINSISASNEITLEAWIKTSSVNQTGPARIITLSKDNNSRLATLGQDSDNSSFNYIARLSTTTTSQNGIPGIISEEPFVDLLLHHVVYTRNNQGEEYIYVNGEKKYSGLREGLITTVKDENFLALANELSGDRPWIGSYYLVAVYSKALEENEITQNFKAGTGVIQFSEELEIDSEIDSEESFFITPFTRTLEGISYGDPVSISTESNRVLIEDSLRMVVYPNPSNGDFNIQVMCNPTNANFAYVRVTDMVGKIMYNERIPLTESSEASYASNDANLDVVLSESVLNISLSDYLNEGLYLITLMVGEEIAGERIVIQH